MGIGHLVFRLVWGVSRLQVCECPGVGGPNMSQPPKDNFWNRC